MKLRLFTCIVVVLFSLDAFAQSSHRTADEVLEQTGIKDQVDQLDDMIESKIEEKKNTFAKPEQFEKFKDIITSGLNSKNAMKFMAEYLEKYSNEDSLKMVITLYKDPFMQEFNKVEKEAASPSKQREMLDFFQNMNANPPAQNRVQQLVSLNQEMRTSEFMAKMMQNVVVSMIRGANKALPGDKQVSDEEIKGKMDLALQGDSGKQLTNQLIAYSIFIYKDVSDEKMNHYLEVWKSPTGKYCIYQLMKAYDYSFSKMFEIAGGLLPVLDKDKK
jgi:phosphatidate phosphatase PAH1